MSPSPLEEGMCQKLRKVSGHRFALVWLMASENAIQAGSKLTAILNEVGAVTHRLVKALLTGDDLSQIRQSLPARFDPNAPAFNRQQAGQRRA